MVASSDSAARVLSRSDTARRQTARLAAAFLLGSVLVTGFVGGARFSSASPPLEPLADQGQRTTSLTTSLTVELLVGGTITGLVVDYNDEAVVLVAGSTPYVVAWAEAEAGSAYAARRDLLAWERGGKDLLTAADYFSLGSFALHRGRRTVAAAAYRKAAAIDGQFETRGREALASYREIKPDDAVTEAFRSSTASGLEQRAGSRSDDSGVRGPSAGTGRQANSVPDEVQAQVLEVYRRFGEQVRGVLGGHIQLVETDHFLIWTDWEPSRHQLLANWCERMYETLGTMFGFDRDEPVFIAKCPVFCFRARKTLRQFATTFDHYDGVEAIGYTRADSRQGHVHVVIARQGRTAEDFDRFATTLVHEGTHAFLHRFHSERPIPHWVNEGLAELTAQRVLQDRCVCAAKADLLARQYVRFDWPLGSFLAETGPIAVQEYPLAHSLMAFLESRGPDRLAAFVRGLKDGSTVAEALSSHYDGWSLEGLEAHWRQAIRDGWAPPRR